MLTDCKFFLDGLVATYGLAATSDIVSVFWCLSQQISYCFGGIGFTAFYRLVMPTDVFHLELDLLSSFYLSNRLTYLISGSIFIISGLCRNKFDANFRVVVGWSANRSLEPRLFRLGIIGLGPNRVGYGPFISVINSFEKQL
jgi:hypothetical protein